MPFCWELRGCDEEMMGRCPHNTPGELCPADCAYAACHRSTHQVALGFAILENPQVDRAAAVKEVCRMCTFFINNGPTVSKEA